MRLEEKIDGFLKQYGMSPQAIDPEACTAAFCGEMTEGLMGRPSSLLMLPTYLSAEGALPKGETALTIDAGGTNFRVALVRFGPSGYEIAYHCQYPMPGAGGRITKEQFLDLVADRLMPVVHQADSIGFCFSYPAEILPDKDARVLYFNKEVLITGSENMILCAELGDRLKRRGVGKKRFVVLNDTVATLMGGLAGGEGALSGGAMGFILGTGTNTCYVERTCEIGKLPEGAYPGGTMIVNIEAAGFDKFPLGEFERRFDSQSAIPGDHLYEKSVSGAYQSGIIYETALQAAADGLLSSQMRAGLAACGGFTGAEVDAFLDQSRGTGKLAGLCPSDEDAAALTLLIDRSYERAARLVTANLAGVMLKGGYGKSEEAPALIVAEGSTFYKSRLLRPKLDRWVQDYIQGTLGRYCRFASAKDANLVGAALAALLNT